MSLVIDLKPWQKRFIKNKSRFKVAVCGRRSGKTVTDAIEIYLQALYKPGSIIWFIAVTHQQAADLVWSWLVDGMMINGKKHPPLFPKEIIKKRDNSIGDLRVELINGSVVCVKGAGNADALLGASLDLLILDEFQSQNEEVWWKLRPMLSDRMGRAIITGTPRGYNHFYDFYWKGAIENPTREDDWFSLQVTTANAGNIPIEEVEQAKKDMSSKQFAQEYLASFTSTEGLVYSDFDKIVHVKDAKELQPPPGKPILIGWDFNVGMMATVHAYKEDGKIKIFHECVLRDTNTKQMAQTLKSMYPGRRLIAHPDPSGRARDTTGDIVGQNDFTIIEAFGIEVDPPPPQNFPGAIEARINTVNWMFSDGNGHSKIEIADHCTNLLRTLQGQIYNEKTGQPTKDNKLDGQADALGYLCLVQAPQRSNFSN